MKSKQLLFIFLLLHPLLLVGQEIRGKITYISDGDAYHFVVSAIFASISPNAVQDTARQDEAEAALKTATDMEIE